MTHRPGYGEGGSDKATAQYVSRGDEVAAQTPAAGATLDDPAERQPKGDHNRRLALKLDADVFAAEAGITVDELKSYEFTPPDGTFDIEIARRIGAALDRLEAVIPVDQRVIS